MDSMKLELLILYLLSVVILVARKVGRSLGSSHSSYMFHQIGARKSRRLRQR